MAPIMFLLVLFRLLTEGDGSDADSCHDVVVVGGGVGGTYAAWKLRQEGLKVGLYEFSNRLGGRYFTHHFSEAPDVPVELGAMRLQKENHPVLYRTIYDVGLKTEKFGGHGNPERLLYYLRGSYLNGSDFKVNNVPYNLRHYESHGISEIDRYLTLRTNFSGDLSSLNEERPFIVSEDGVKLVDQTFTPSGHFTYFYRYLEFLEKYLSKDAIKLLQHVIVYGLRNVTAAVELTFTPPVGPLPPVPDMLTISGGMQKLPERLVELFLSASSKHSVHMNHKLVSIRRQTKDRQVLGFLKTVTKDGRTYSTRESTTVCTRRVVLAIPIQSLLDINSEVLKRSDIRPNLNSINEHKCSKLFLLYDFPWWKNNRVCQNTDSSSIQATINNYVQSWISNGGRPNGVVGPSIHSDLPLDITIDFGFSRTTGKAVLLAAYNIQEMWTNLQSFGEPIGNGFNSVSSEVVRHAHLYLAELYNVSFADIPAPTEGIFYNWREFPYVNAFTYAKEGTDWIKLWETIRKLALKEDIFVASGTYSKHMSDSWSEYCLESVDDLLDNYMRVPFHLRQ
ncbi:achacin-like [Argopecten irradians]|uniref:achacin-like n=1 Tax=Argopecten irradians TaxID=31199 RepID=UPI00371B5BE8